MEDTKSEEMKGCQADYRGQHEFCLAVEAGEAGSQAQAAPGRQVPARTVVRPHLGQVKTLVEAIRSWRA